MKTIIEMAREAGLIVDANQSGFDSVEAFAALVRAEAQAEEREAILDLVDSYAKNNTDLADAIRARGNT
jgi:hypothetical protein